MTSSVREPMTLGLGPGYLRRANGRYMAGYSVARVRSRCLIRRTRGIERASTIERLLLMRGTESGAGRLAVRRLGEKSLEHPEVRLLLAVPRDPLQELPATRPSHLRAPGCIAQQAVDLLGESRHVPGFGVSRRAARKHPGLIEVEAHERHAEGHVLHRLHRRDDVFEVRLEPEVRRREIGEGLLLGRPAREARPVANVEVARQ